MATNNTQNPGSIYQAKCKTTQKIYIGQTQNFKSRNDKPYRYGIMGRWSDHVSSATRGAKTPLAAAINTHGADDFEVTALESDIAPEMLDAREAHWIETLKTVVPSGYNVMRHARCKHRENTTIAEHYLPRTKKVRMTSINRGGAPRIVYVYLDLTTNEIVRFAFGQGTGITYEQAYNDAQEFATIFALEGIDIIEEEADDPLKKYREKIEMLKYNNVTQIRIANFNQLVALYAKHDEGTLRICFGGKTIKQEDAYNTAITVKNAIVENTKDVIFKNEYRSPQQAAAYVVEATTT